MFVFMLMLVDSAMEMDMTAVMMMVTDYLTLSSGDMELTALA